MKTAAISRIEDKLEELDETTFRYQLLDTCRKFKTTWIDLGQGLYSVHRDKLFLEWGFMSFDKYCTSELGIKNATAMKLLKSYSFMEKEEPEFIQKSHAEPTPDQKYPEMESVNLLRLAKKNKDIEEADYQRIRNTVLEDAKDPTDVRKEIRMLSDQGPAKNPEDVRADRRGKFLKKLYNALETAKLESMAHRFLPPKVIDELDNVSLLVEKELNRE
ncbi:MAG: hypothetical protein ACI9CF_001085 [Candidatus Omnitrophota bacterium]|jgi:hypothetical protein